MNKKWLGILLILSVAIPFSLGFFGELVNYDYGNNVIIHNITKWSLFFTMIFSIWSGVILIKLGGKKDENKTDKQV